MYSVWSNRIIFLLALAGVGVALYLTMAHMNVLALVCGKTHGCEEVAAHPSAHGFGIPALSSIPTAAFGLMMYVAVVFLAFLRVVSPSGSLSRKAGLAIWALAFVGVLIAGWLTYMEAYVIQAWCIYCVASAGITLLIFLTATGERLVGRMSTRVPSDVRGEVL